MILNNNLILWKEIAVEVENDSNIKNLQTVPGIGELTAVAYSGFVGDGSRFDNGAQVSNYLGLVPKLDISCDQVHYGNITKTGKPYSPKKFSVDQYSELAEKALKSA